METRTRWLAVQAGLIGFWGLLCLMTGKGLGVGFQAGFPVWPQLPVSWLERLCALSGLGVMLTFPGLGLALFWPSERPISWTWLGLRTVFGSLVAFVLSLSVLKVLGLPVSPLSILALGGVLGMGVARRFRTRAPELAPLRLELSAAISLVLGLLLLVALGLTHRAFMARDLEDYFYDPSLMAPETLERPGLEAQGITLGMGEGGVALPAEHRLIRYEDVPLPLELSVQTLSRVEVPLRFVWQGPVPGRISLSCRDAAGLSLGQTEQVLMQAPVEALEEGPTLRYLERGTAVLVLKPVVSGQARCVLESAHPGLLLDLSDWPDAQGVEATQGQGLILTHYYQILNIAENLAWARETLESRWVTLNQPPAWSYVYAALVLFVGDGLWSASLFFLLGVVATAWVGFAAVCADDAGDARTGSEALRASLCIIPMLGMAWMHARITIESGSTNFPDHLYALGGMACLLALVEGRRWGFAVAGSLTVLLRYPGLLVAAGLPVVLGWRNAARRRLMQEALGRLALILGGVCLAFLGVGVVSGQVSHWLEILHFETFPEHFHGIYDVRELLARPPEFYGTLLRYSGFTPLLLLIVRSRLAVRVGVLLVAYTAVLSVIDHFPSHYFVTPLYLIGVAVASSLRRLTGVKGWVALGLTCVACLGTWASS